MDGKIALMLDLQSLVGQLNGIAQAGANINPEGARKIADTLSKAVETIKALKVQDG